MSAGLAHLNPLLAPVEPTNRWRCQRRVCPPRPGSTLTCAFPVVSEGSSFPIQDEPAFYTSCPGSQLLTSQPLLLLWHVPTTLIPSSSSTSSLPASGRAYTFPCTWLILQPSESGVGILLCLRGTDFTRDLSLSLLFVVNPVKDSSCGLTLLAYRCFQMTLPLSISK